MFEKKTLESPWTARRSDQSILKEIGPEYSLEGLMLKLKLQYFGHLMQRTDFLEKTLMLGKIEGRRRRGWQRMSWMAWPTQWTWVWVNSRSWWWTGRPHMLQSMGSQRVRQDWGTKLISKKVSHNKCLKITRLVKRFLLRRRNSSLSFLLNREGTQLHPSTENWIKDLLSMSPPIRTRPSSPHS